MGFSLWNLFKVGLLLVNSVMILNKPRFLAKYGIDDYAHNGGSANTTLQHQIVNFLQAVRFLKIPVIIANVITMFIEIIAGG